MIQTILTKKHPATDTKGARISATGDNGKRIYSAYDHSRNLEGNHEKAAREYISRKAVFCRYDDLRGVSLPDSTSQAKQMLWFDLGFINATQNHRH